MMTQPDEKDAKAIESLPSLEDSLVSLCKEILARVKPEKDS